LIDIPINFYRDFFPKNQTALSVSNPIINAVIDTKDLRAIAKLFLYLKFESKYILTI